MDLKPLRSHKNLHKNVYSTFIHNYQNLETTKMSFNRGMDKQAVEYPDDWLLFSDKKAGAIDPGQKYGRILVHVYQEKEASVKRLHIFIRHFGKSKTLETVKKSMVARVWGGEEDITDEGTGHFLGWGGYS